jgi:hypothetical protein
MTRWFHKGEFLVKSVRDRKRWLDRLFEAKKCYALPIFNYAFISNHIYLLVVDGVSGVMPKSL